MQALKSMNVLFAEGFGPIVRAAREEGKYLHGQAARGATRKAGRLSLILYLLSMVAGQAFAQNSLYQITSRPDPRSGANLTTPSFGAVNAPKIADIPLSPLPIQIEPDPFTGGLTARMHLAMPIAKGRSAPDLALAYHSQQSYGSLGVGWSFSAGSIVRNKARGIDYSSKDFLLSLGSSLVDLVNVEDDLYRDKQGDLRIEAQYDPASDSWVVFDSFGTKYAFGSAHGSRLSGAGGTIQWSLDRVEDLSGNYSELTYRKAEGELNLTSLLFSGNSRSQLQPRNKVDITYEAQPHEAIATSYVGGIHVTNSIRIRQIRITANGHLYATYSLKYRSSQETARSLLVGVTREAGPFSSSIDFAYSDKIKSDSWARAQVTGPTRTATIYSQCLMGDFDGEGKADLACALDTSGKWQVGISKGASDNGNWTQIKQKYDGFNVGVWPGPVVNKQTTIDIPFSGPNIFAPDKKVNIADVRTTCLTGDFNGDSKTDIACYNSSDGSWNVGLSNGHGFDVSVWRNGPVMAGGAGGDKPLTDRCVVGDFDGDGKTDIACLVSPTASSDEGKWSIALSTGHGWKTSVWTGSSPTGPSEKVADACVAADFNGDRRQDIACYGATDHVWHVAISTGTTFRSSVWANGPAIVGDLGPQAVVPSHCVVGDFNGDGNADIACYTGTSGSEEFDGKWSMGFSTGSGWNTVEWLGPPVPTSKNDGWVVANQCITGDFNGDGRTDIACNYGGDPKYSTPFAKANGDCPDKPLAQRAAAGCHLVLVWGASLSTGSGFASSLFSPVGSVALRSTAWGLPWASCVAADFTGDGKSDLLCDWGIQSDQYVLNISDFQPTDVLTEVREPLGLKGQFSYGFSSFEKGSELGFSLPVLKRSLFSDGLTATAANYTYSGGAYFKAANRFRGFHQTRITHHDDSATRRLLEVLSFHQGDGLAPDQDSARDVTGLTVGKLYRRMLQGRQKRTLLTTLLEYQLEPTTIANQKAPRLVRETTGISSSTGPVRKSTALSYDEAGNVSDIVIASGNEPDSLETHEHLSYSNDSEAHAFGFPLLRELSDNQFGALERTAYSYDTAACNNPAQGTRLWQLTGVKRWLSADISAEEKYSRSASGNVTCYEDALGNQTVATFDDQDEYMSKITDPLNHTVAFRYYGVDSEAPGATAGLVSSRTNASGDTAQFFYDVFGRLRMVINPDASSVKISYHNFGDPKNQSILSESSAALVSKQLMDGYGRRYVFSESAPQGKAVGFAASYDKNGELERIGAPAVLPSLNDKPSRKTIQYEMKRDELGRVVSLRDARRVLKRSCYDGLRAARLDANGSGWVDTFDVFGNRVATEEYVQKFDDCNRVLQYRQSSSGSGAQQTGVTTTLYKFDALNRVRQVARQGKVLTSIAYDGLGNATSVMNVDRGTSRYSYDKSGRLKRSQPDSTRTIELSRDALGRVTEVFSVGEDDKRSLLEAFTYDQGPHASGLITAGEAQGVRTALSYDTMGRVTHEVDSADGHDFDLKLAYDALGRVDDITYPDGMQIQNRYEGSMLATVESERQTFAQLESFNGYLEPTSLLLGNGLRETRAYGDSDPRSNRDNASCKSVPASYLCLISATGSDDSDRFGLTYRYDATGNVVQIDDATLGGTSFSYDSLDRLTAEMGSVASGRPDVKYNYDQFGRRASASDEGAYQYRDASVAFSAPSEVGHISSSYDEGGRRQTYGEENYKFDAFGRLSEVRMPAQKMSVRYRYDAFGDVISRKLDVNSRSEEVYFVSGYAECVQAASNAGVKCRDLIYGPTGLMAGLRSGDAGVGLGRESEYYHLDRNGTIRFITDQSGSSTARLSYSAFGIPELQGSAQNSLPGRTRSLDQYYYAGHRWDPNSGLYYFGARFYDPRIGQFLSPDTDAIIASGGINTYTYARNNPNRWIDPDGKDVGGSGGFSGSMSMTINIGGGPNMSGFSGSGPSFSASPNISFNFGGPGVGHGSLFVGGPEVPAFSGSNATLAPLEQNQVAAGGLTNFVGIAGAVVTPVGGGGIGVGFYSDSYGMVGAYLSVAPEAGLPGGSLGITAGSSHSFAGESISASWGGGYGALGASRGYSISPSTGEVTGEQWSAGLAFGPPVAASVGYSSTQTTEFTSLYLAYIQFLNWIGYPSFR